MRVGSARDNTGASLAQTVNSSAEAAMTRGRMNLRRVVFPGILAVSAGLGLFSACSAPDPGLVIFSTNPAKIKPDSGIVTLTDASTGAEGGPSAGLNAFAGEAMFISTSGASTDEAQHKNLFGTTNPAGHDCMTCHLPDATTPFIFGGTVENPDGGDGGIGGLEVRMLLPNGSPMATYTNSEGNFYYLAEIGQPIEAGAIVGVRSAAAAQTMPDLLTGPAQGGCNQAGTCHGGTQGAIQPE